MRAPRAPVRKRFGQHFLERAWVEKLVRAIDPRPNETFFEIGPGRGAITIPLAERAQRVVAFEIDRDLAALLRERAPANVEIVEGDFLGVMPDALRRFADGPVRAAGNLPYNVASPILFKLIDLHAAGLPLTDATVMVQREVADRLVARPGTRDYGVLSVMIQQATTVDRVLALPPGAFRPPPRVHSAVVRLRFHAPDPRPTSQAVFAAMVQAIFTQRRKTLANALTAYVRRERASFPADMVSSGPVLEAAEIDPRRRPETLTIPELVRIADALAEKGSYPFSG